jgi:Na+-transporting methylmalonyl-CoA/oxaloacetate decarboxylase gamma subunit
LTDFQTGLMISVVGLVVTFSALLIFIGVMVLLQKLFPVKKKNQTSALISPDKPVELTIESESGDEEITAALAAIVFLRSQNTGQLGATLVYGPGPYRTLR